MAIKGLEDNPRLVRMSATLPGRLVLVGGFALVGRYWPTAWGLQASAVLAILTIWPAQRRLLVGIASLYFLFRWPPYFKLAMGDLTHPCLWRGIDLRIGFVVAILAFAYLTLRLFRDHPEAWLCRRPLRNMLILFFGLLVAAAVLPLPSLVKLSLWGLLAVASKFIWFLAYALFDRKGTQKRSPLRSTFYLQPFWGPFAIPFGKGESNLDHFEVKNDQELGISQLRGLELMLWSVLLIQAHAYYQHLIMGTLWPLCGWLKVIHVPMPVPSIEHAIAMYLKGTPLPRSHCWLAAVSKFTNKMLWLFGWGGSVVATCWMAGFKILPNTDKPFRSKTIAEFYNRYYFYFKELLVNFFFYPAFFRYFKTRPRLRIFFATFAAAGIGNAIYHFTQNISLIYEKGLWRAAVGFQVYLFYTVVLGTSIGLSQLRAMNKSVRPGRITGPLFVLTFYCVVMIMDIQFTTWSVRDVSCFIFNLFIPLTR